VIPPAERAVGGPLHPGRVHREHLLQRIPDAAAVLDALRQAVRFGQRAHVGGHPEVAFGLRRVEFDGEVPGGHAAIEGRAAIFFGQVRAQPVAGARELPRALKILAAGRPRRPDICRLLRARQVFTLFVERIGIDALR
jgi:hypothetical protein